MSHTVYPQTVVLPDGTQARVRIVHVVETNDKGEATLTQLVLSPPQYELRDGTTVELDVTIPDDLLATGWFWRGSSLHWPADDPLRTIGIPTDGYPPPPYPSERGSCFDCARRFEAMRAERHEQHVAERVRKATKARRPRPRQQASEDGAPESQVRALTQLELF